MVSASNPPNGMVDSSHAVQLFTHAGRTVLENNGHIFMYVYDGGCKDNLQSEMVETNFTTGYEFALLLKSQYCGWGW
ncbi:hypothetical protein PGT21_005049 [Puccinia graminis f. sp. tritici]|uniref:Uncharacterized protein n=1 Tax=Puccinia graminis f. sp. tritici TaxID=56615 RepID=A0A5B0PTI3_PUCGR|nr:hypothetical protein PGTUg99_023039 [Puccinia graminis f. sp. tritici]KAA1103940.1 hypothetical protein PGT21_005049 [Puccinia graminis f. sp. tritici]